MAKAINQSQENKVSYLFLAPFLTVFLVFLAYPIVYSFFLSFQESGTGYSLNSLEWVGLKNYFNLFTDIEFLWAVLMTFYYALLIMPLGILSSLVLAILLNNKISFKNVFRSAYFLPNILDMLVIGIIWTLIYSKDGVVDKFIKIIFDFFTFDFLGNITNSFFLSVFTLFTQGVFYGLILFFIYKIYSNFPMSRYVKNEKMAHILDILVYGVTFVLIFGSGGLLGGASKVLGSAVNNGVLGTPATCMPAVVFALVVKGAGFGMILFLAAIQNISESVYEAADIDGCNEVQKFFYITLPLVKPIIFFMAVTGIIGALNAFTEIYAMTKGGPIMTVFGKSLGATKLTGYYLFTKWEQSEFGYAAAMSYALLVLTIIISKIQEKVLSPED
ncbi:MAG: hypothetical protein A2008_09010 [Candidatus Wallbacteria bacterium GWC2_49_35]|uniref:ABC transmembrane type-1 domain-containing protein n=1 Tax=Candidatus Wallbacteria bacterium GWC2_49_35 TaxID=1817813 RepID=A0A1F7WI43_9BACT|nr:MAG: hypothetical protein A2008_09010 [Candidatus Wallbacteria bacterium GWC2_49_35]HBC74677.1 hypothetical protein [Candidatus Wallbacteria bacterium]